MCVRFLVCVREGYCYAASSSSIIPIVIKCLPLIQRYSNFQNRVIVFYFADKNELRFFVVVIYEKKKIIISKAYKVSTGVFSLFAAPTQLLNIFFFSRENKNILIHSPLIDDGSLHDCHMFCIQTKNIYYMRILCTHSVDLVSKVSINLIEISRYLILSTEKNQS